MDNLQAVRPIHNAPNRHPNEHTITKVVSVDNSFLFCMHSKGEPLNEQCTFATLKVDLIAAPKDPEVPDKQSPL